MSATIHSLAEARARLCTACLDELEADDEPAPRDRWSALAGLALAIVSATSVAALIAFAIGFVVGMLAR
jgi:hypothetical protein